MKTNKKINQINFGEAFRKVIYKIRKPEPSNFKINNNFWIKLSNF